MKKCSKCLLPETYETIEFSDDNSCNICNSVTNIKKNIDWKKRYEELKKIVFNHKGKKDYDCIIPFSGGKDSTFQLLYLINEFKLKPLVIRFNHGFLRDVTKENTQRTLRKLGADFLDFTPNWKIVKLLMLESFTRKTDFCWHCHTGIYSYPVRMAISLKIPLIIWGEPLAEMSAYYSYDEMEKEDEKKFDKVRNLGISADDMYGMLIGSGHKIDKRDLLPYTFPDKKIYKENNIQSINLGNYIKWNYEEQTKLIKKKLNWQSDELEGVPDEANPYSSKIECYMQGTRDYIKYIKRGYGRISQNMSTLLRSKSIDIDKAKELIKYEGKKPQSLEIFLDYVGLTEKEFNTICKSMSIPPYDHDFKSNKFAEKTRDFDKWQKD